MAIKPTMGGSFSESAQSLKNLVPETAKSKKTTTNNGKVQPHTENATGAKEPPVAFQLDSAKPVTKAGKHLHAVDLGLGGVTSDKPNLATARAAAESILDKVKNRELTKKQGTEQLNAVVRQFKQNTRDRFEMQPFVTDLMMLDQKPTKTEVKALQHAKKISERVKSGNLTPDEGWELLDRISSHIKKGTATWWEIQGLKHPGTPSAHSHLSPKSPADNESMTFEDLNPFSKWRNGRMSTENK